MKTKTLLFSAFAICLLWMFTASALMVLPENKTELNRKIASVNGVEIKKKDFKWAYASELIRLTGTIGYLKDEELIRLKKMTFDRLINRELLYQESLRTGIEISPMDVETAYKRARSEMMAPVDHSNIEETLDLTVADIKDEFRRAFAAQKTVDNSVRIDSSVTRDEMESYYLTHKEQFISKGRVRVSHILIEFPPNAHPAQKALIRSDIELVRQKIDNGENFEELSRQYSNCLSRANGGDIGFLPRGRSDEKFETAAYSLNSGEISDIVETSYGYHIIKVTDRESDSEFALDEAIDQVQKFVLADKESLAVGQFINSLKAKSIIEVFMDPVDID